MKWLQSDYRDASTQRLKEADISFQDGRYSLSMYLAGVAAECMLRAYQREPEFDGRHDVVRLFQACDFERFGERAQRRLRAPIETIRELWLNGFRYATETMIRRHLKRKKHDRDLKRNADVLKVKCSELFDACEAVVTMGVEEWT